jgi:excisionase family DNA binding protein
MTILIRYRELLAETGDKIAAAVLTLAERLPAVDEPAGSLLTVKEAAERLSVGTTTNRELLATGKLGGVRVGLGRGAIRIRPEDIDAFKRDALPAGTADSGGVSIETIRQLAKPASKRTRRGPEG